MVSQSARRRYCRCGTHLAADNTGSQCAQCERVSRDKLIAPPVYGPSGISQTLLGQWLDLSQPQISRIETGPPVRDLDTLAYWARVLQIPPKLLWFRLPEDKSQPVTAEVAGTDPQEHSASKLPEPPSTTMLVTSTDEQTAKQLGTDSERGVPSDPMRRRTLVTWGLATTASAGMGLTAGGQVGAAYVARLQGPPPGCTPSTSGTAAKPYGKRRPLRYTTPTSCWSTPPTVRV